MLYITSIMLDKYEIFTMIIANLVRLTNMALNLNNQNAYKKAFDPTEFIFSYIEHQ